jgi:hypothetical protein
MTMPQAATATIAMMNLSYDHHLSFTSSLDHYAIKEAEQNKS